MKWAFENTSYLKHIKNYFENGKDECFPPKIFDWSMMFWLVKQSKSLNGQWLVNQLLILHPMRNETGVQSRFRCGFFKDFVVSIRQDAVHMFSSLIKI